MSDTAVSCTVDVKLYGLLRDHFTVPGRLPHRPISVTMPGPATVADLIVQLSLPDELVHAVAINRETAELDRLLQSGDQVSLFPPTAGG